MEAFLSNLAKELEQHALTLVTRKLSEFADCVITLPELKGVTKAQVLECWNSVSDVKINPEAPTPTPVAGSASPKSTKPRAQTDKTRKCQVPKQRGANAGEPCGKNCEVGSDFCPAHNPERKAAAKATSSAAPSMTAPGVEQKVAPDVPMGPFTSEGLTKLTVVKLKEICAAKGVSKSGTKPELVARILAAP